MSANSRADTVFKRGSSRPFSDTCPDRRQRRHPTVPISFKTSNIQAQDGAFNLMDELSLNYSYLNLNDLPVVEGPNSELNMYQYADTYDPSNQHQIAESPLILPLHAPVPSSGHGPVFMDPDYIYRNPSHTIETQAPDAFYMQSGHLYETQELRQDEMNYCSMNYEVGQELPSSFYPEYFGAVTSVQAKFPTPSELLDELAAKARQGHNPIGADEHGADVRTESASKARRRAMAKSIGFIPTDPDIISSHEKKRHYLECLEQYIMYLHEQFELVGATPDRLQPVASYKGLSSRSIRTLLVHMENTTRKLNTRTQAEEQKFVNLSNVIMRREKSGR